MSDFTVKQGTDSGRRWPVRVRSTGEPADLTGWTVRAQVRREAGSPAVLYEWSTALSNAMATADGFVWLLWTPAQTALWTWRSGTYDIELTSPAGKVMRLDSGKVHVSAEVTH